MTRELGTGRNWVEWDLLKRAAATQLQPIIATRKCQSSDARACDILEKLQNQNSLWVKNVVRRLDLAFWDSF